MNQGNWKKGKGQLVIQNNTNIVNINNLDRAVSKLVNKSIYLKIIDDNYKIKIETNNVYPDKNESEDSEMLYSVSLYLIKDVSSAEEAFKELSLLLNLPKNKLILILENVKTPNKKIDEQHEDVKKLKKEIHLLKKSNSEMKITIDKFLQEHLENYWILKNYNSPNS